MKRKVENPKPGSHKYNLVGNRFGKLVVIEYFGLDKYKNKMWLCKCDCGNTTKVTTTNLNKGTTTSCKCNQYKKGEGVYNFNGYKEISGTKWCSIKSNADRRGLEFKITKEFVWCKILEQDNKCYFSDLPISFLNKTASIDRLNSSIGYIESNIVLVHKDINRMKTDFSVEYFNKLCELVSKNKNK